MLGRAKLDPTYIADLPFRANHGRSDLRPPSLSSPALPDTKNLKSASRLASTVSLAVLSQYRGADMTGSRFTLDLTVSIRELILRMQWVRTINIAKRK